MNRPNSYDEVSSYAKYVEVELGGHFATIKQVSERQSNSGKDMIVVLFDFDSKDPQCGCFADEFQNDTREERKWPYKGTKYIMVNDYADSSKISKDFKSFCTAVENSNSGFKISWGGNWGKQFVGKRVGVVYRLEESEYNDKVSMKPSVAWFCNYNDADRQTVPKPKYLKTGSVFKNLGNAAAAPTGNNSGNLTPESDDEELPF